MAQIVNLRNQKRVASTEQAAPSVPQKPVQSLATRLARRAQEPNSAQPSATARGIAWRSPLTYHTRSSGYGALVGVALAWLAAGWFFWEAQWFAGVVLACAGASVLFFQKSSPTFRTIHIQETGVVIDDAYYPWNELKSFWVDYRAGGIKELSLEFTRWHRPYMRVLLAEQDPIAVRALLLGALPERQHPISLIDFWVKRY